MLFVELVSLGRAIYAVPPEAFDFRMLYSAGYMVRTGEGESLYDQSREEQVQNNVVSHHAVALPFNHLFGSPSAANRFGLRL